MVIQGTSKYIVIKLIYYGIYMLHTSLQCHHISKYHGIAVLIQHIYIAFTHLPLFLDMFPKPQTRLEEKNDRFTSKPTGLLVLVSGKTLQAKPLFLNALVKFEILGNFACIHKKRHQSLQFYPYLYSECFLQS